jgi:hypothetical protein
MAFGDDQATVTLDTPCGSAVWTFDQDSDGDGINFYGSPIPTSTCTELEAATTASFVDALSDVEAWHVENPAAIVLANRVQLRLDREGAPGAS